MATYKVQAPDGSIIELEGPEGATDVQLAQAAQAAYAQRQQRAQAVPASSAQAPASTAPGTPAALSASSQVTPTQQAGRDKDAIPILMRELQTAQTKAQAGDSRAQSDIESISRELARKGVNVRSLTTPAAPADAPASVPIAAPAPSAQPQMGFFEGLAEQFTGSKRSASPEVALALAEKRTIYDMPETNQLSFGLIKSAFGGLLANPEEKAKILQANIPGITYRKDQFGTVFLKSPTNNKEYVIEPGLTTRDIPAVVGGVAAFTPAGRAATIPAAIVGAGATQAVIEATQAATGGEINPADIGMAAATGPAGQIIQRVVPPVVQAVKSGAQRVMPRPASVRPRVEPIFKAPGAPMGTAMAPEAPPATAIPEPTPMAAAVPEAPVAPVMPATAESVEAVAEAAPMTFTGQLERADASEVLNLARKASGMGPGSSAAKARLVDMAQVNPEAAAAAQRLNIDVPFDVLSDNPQVRNAVGLTRALVAGEAEAAWEITTRAAIQRADEISQQFDARFIEGRPATGATSQRIIDNLTNTRDALEANSKVIYDRINGVEGGADGLVPKSTIIDLSNLNRTLQKVMTEVGDKGLSSKEKELLELATQPGVTYGRLLREKSLIGKAQAGLESPYGSMAEADLKRLYGALAQDQLDNVGAVAGEEVRRELRGANLMTAKRKALEKRIIGAFGKEIDGSVAQKMQSAISTASTGDAAAFNRLMKVVPQELQKETVATALASVTAGKAAGRAGVNETVFSPSEFTKVYRGLRANPPVYTQMVKIMGPEWDRASRDLYEISKRIADAQARIPTTGKANQILGDMAVNGLFSQVMSSGAAQRVVTGVAGLVPGGGLIAPDIIGFMAGAKGSGVQKAAKLFADPAFQKLAVEAATTGQASDATIRRTAMSQSFQKFADQIKLPKELDARVQFLQSAIQTGRQSTQENQ
jgi:hypothetical protein